MEIFSGLFNILYVFVLLFFSIVLHELSHGWVAEKLGDPTPRMSGRMTFNPISHVDPVGTVLLPAFFVITHSPIFFGWAKPVPVNPRYFKDPEKDMALVALAGPMSNLLIAWLFSLIFRFFTITDGFWVDLIRNVMYINIVFAVFNLVPIPPLDGSRLLRVLLPYDLKSSFDRLEQYGLIIVIGLLMFGLSSLVLSISSLIFSLLV